MFVECSAPGALSISSAALKELPIATRCEHRTLTVFLPARHPLFSDSGLCCRVTQSLSFKLARTRARGRILWCLIAINVAALLYGSEAPIFLAGSVLTEEGLPPSEPLQLELVCGGISRQAAYADAAGRFELQIDPVANPFSDEGRAKTAPVLREPSPNFAQPQPWMGLRSCEIRVTSPGFQSASFNLDIGDARGLTNIGTLVLHRMGRQRQWAISASSLRIPRRASRAWQKGRRALESGKLAEAQAALDAAVKAYPPYAAAWADLGRLSLSRGDRTQARARYLRAKGADSSFIPALVGLTVVSVDEGNWQEAADWAGRAIRLHPSGFPQIHYLYALGACLRF